MALTLTGNIQLTGNVVVLTAYRPAIFVVGRILEHQRVLQAATISNLLQPRSNLVIMRDLQKKQ
jgi:hypothetical protein